MNKIQFDKSKIKRHEGKKPKKTLLLEIVAIPEELKSRNIKDEEGYLNVDDVYYAIDYYDPKGSFKWGVGIILFSIILHFYSGGGFDFILILCQIESRYLPWPHKILAKTIGEMSVNILGV